MEFRAYVACRVYTGLRFQIGIELYVEFRV